MARIKKTCEICGTPFEVAAYREITARFCSGSCRAKWVCTLPSVRAYSLAPKPHMRGNKFRLGLAPAHSFPKGNVPWNKDMKGIHLSPESQFKPGPRPEKRAAIGAERQRRDKHGGYRVYVKVADPNVWVLRSVKVWEDANGPVPKGKLIHHHDHDKTNDDLGNLRCLTRAEHLEEHRAEIRAARWG